MLDDLLIDLTAIELRVDQYFVDDAYGISGYVGPHLYGVLHAGQLATLTSDGRVVRPIARDIAVTALELADRARGEDPPSTVDTAVGRTLTILTLSVRHARGPSASFVTSMTINHCNPHMLPPGWSTLLRTLRDVAGAVAVGTADAWDLAMAWTSPVDLGPTWRAGGVVVPPHVVTSVANRGSIFVRTGQPHTAAPSSLYEVSHGEVRCLDDGQLLASVDGNAQRFVLPCGGGVVSTYAGLHEPRRVVVRVDDPARGIYLQRGDG